MRVTVALVSFFIAVAFSASAFADGASDLVRRLGRGINILSSDQIWGNTGESRFKDHYYRMIRESGFNHVRVNLHPFEHMDDDGKLDEKWLATLDNVVKEAIDAQLMVILDVHNFEFCAENAEGCRKKLIPLWEQLALRYKNEPDSVLFEILNEPTRAISQSIWNGLLTDVLAVIRESNPKRGVVIGPADSNKFTALDSLRLPAADRNIIVTFHYYEPFPFTHQGTAWSRPSRKDKVGVEWSDVSEGHEITRDFALVSAWAKRTDRPILLGEFGTYEKGDMGSRVAWTSTVARTAEAYGFAWSYWQFEYDFSAYSIEADAWIDPIKSALIPPSIRSN